MNELLLINLLRLFAIIVDGNRHGVYGTAKDVIANYLKKNFPLEAANYYLEKFSNYLDEYNPEDAPSELAEGKGIRSFDLQNIELICKNINIEFQQEQKVWMTLQLLEFISDGGIITESELNIIHNIALIFKISEEEYKNCRSFILGSEVSIPLNENMLVISDESESPAPKPKHLNISGLEGKILVLHIESTDTFIFRYFGTSNLLHNGHNIKPKKSYIFGVGSVIRSPKAAPIYYTVVASKFIKALEKSKLIFTAKDIEFKFKGTDNGIKKFSFNGKSGELVGIMGGSGSGKSTLLNVLNGKLKPSSGSITINGHNIHEDLEDLEGVIGYVPQDDLLIEELSVYENLYFNARLCFKNYNEDKLKELVDNVLIDFDLVEARDLRVGNPLNKIISGGQRKRLNIGLELMREPSVLFVDEPTSGLSSNDSEKVMNLLKRQTLKGKLVMCVIHQPSSDIFKLFDRLLIIDQGGSIIYRGNPIDAIVYFKKSSNFVNADESECLSCGNVNTEQILRIVEAREVNEFGKLTRKRRRSPNEWYNRYKSNIEAKKATIEIPPKSKIPQNSFHIPNRIKQFKIFLARNLKAKLSNKQYILINMLEAPILALILAYCTKYFAGAEGNPDAYIFRYNNNIPAFFLMSTVVALFIGLTVSAEEIFRDRRILMRESYLNLSRFSYLNSKIATLFLISAIQGLFFVAISHKVLGFQSMFHYQWIIFFSAACCANLIGLNISSAFNSAVTIYITIPLILVPQLLFSGVIIKFDEFHKNISNPELVPLIGDFMPSRWAYEAAMVSQFKHNKYGNYFFDIDQEISDATYNAIFLIPYLESTCNSLEHSINNKNEFKNNIDLLKNETIKVSQKMNVAPKSYTFLNKLSGQSSLADIKDCCLYLKELKKLSLKDLNKLNDKKDATIKTMLAQNGNQENSIFHHLQDQNSNDAVDNMLTRKYQSKQLIIKDNKIIRKYAPIYNIPENTHGRAHFYAPVKRVGTKKIDTFWTNITAIWIMTLFMYILLWMNTLKRISVWIENLKLRYNSRKPLNNILTNVRFTNK